MKSQSVTLPMDEREAHDVHHALSMAVQLIEQVHAMPGGIPRDAALQFDARDRLIRVAQRLDHERRHHGRVANPDRRALIEAGAKGIHRLRGAHGKALAEAESVLVAAGVLYAQASAPQNQERQRPGGAA